MNSKFPEVLELIDSHGTLKGVKISGQSNKEDAREIAEAWCDENNCLLKPEPYVAPPQELQQLPTFYFTVFSDDYK